MSCEIPKWKKAEELGGEDEKEKKDDDCIGCDKPDHAQRSLYHQPNHAQHWKDHLEVLTDRSIIKE